VLWAGPGAALAGLTAATLGGLSGFADRGPRAERQIHVLVPAFVVREDPGSVARQIRDALRQVRPAVTG